MFRLFDAISIDIRQALRRISHAPVLSLVVILTLALAIAANTTIFSLLKPTVLRKLSSPDPDTLVGISATDARTHAYSAIHLPALQYLQQGKTALSALAGFTSSVV